MSLRHTALGFCLVLSACAGQTGQPAGIGSRAESLVRGGDALLAESNFEGALAAYRDAIESDPEFARAYSRLAYAQLFHPGSQPEAIEQASRATELEPESGEAWAYLSRALDWNGRFEEALEAAERAADLSPQDAEVQSFLAEILADLRMYDKAVVAAERAVRLDPENAEAHRNLAYVYEFTGRKQEALTEYQRAYELESEFVHRHTSLAAYYLFEVDELESGREWLESAQQLAPDDYITLLFLARVHSDRGEVEQAIAYCERILEQAPGSPDGHNCLGGVYLDAALGAARDYLLQCRRVAGFDGATFPPELAQRSQYAGRESLEALRQGLAAMGIEAQAEFQPGQGGENLIVLAYAGIGQPGSAEFLAQQSLVSFAGSLVAARTVVPGVDGLVVVSLNSDGNAVGLLEIRAQDAKLWELGVLNDAQFTSFWRAIEP